MIYVRHEMKSKNKLLFYILNFFYWGLGVAMLVSGSTAIEGIVTQNAAAILVGCVGVVVTSYGIAVVSSRISEQE